MTEKKQYTTDDNIRSMLFEVKRIGKLLDALVAALSTKKDDDAFPNF